MINIIAAVGKNLELGLDNKLIWNIPEDLQYFKKMTMNKVKATMRILVTKAT